MPDLPGRGDAIQPSAHLYRPSSSVFDFEWNVDAMRGIDAQTFDTFDASALARDLSTRDAHMYYTSGTTGAPKGVTLTHAIVGTHAVAVTAEMRLCSRDVWLHAAPMFHLVDAFATYAVSWTGGRHVTTPTFTADIALAIERERVTVTNLASTMVAMMTHSPAARLADLSSLRVLSCGGCPLAPPPRDARWRSFGCEFFLSYGMTECCGKIAVSTPSDETRRVASHDEQLDRVCTSGRPFSLVDVRVTHPTAGREVFAAAPGDEASSRLARSLDSVGPTVFGGYWRRPDADEECFDEDGWFNTGDLATVRTDGYVVLVDRKKDMILVGGENVYCSEVEAALHAHPAVAQAAAFGVSHPVMGEIVQAAVTLARTPRSTKHTRRPSSDTVVDRSRSTRFPRACAASELPTNASGKILKRELRKLAEEGALTRRAVSASGGVGGLGGGGGGGVTNDHRPLARRHTVPARVAPRVNDPTRFVVVVDDANTPRRRRSSPRRRSRARGDHMDFGEERIERVRLGDGVFLRGDRRRRRRRRRARRRAGIPRVRHLWSHRLRVEDEFATARDLDERWVLCAKKASLDRIDETIAAGTISASTRAFATGVAFAAYALRTARRIDLDAEDFVGRIPSASVPSDIVPAKSRSEGPSSLCILAEVRRALIDAGAPADIADDAPLMASGLASAGAAASHAAMERAFGARLPATLVFDRPTVTDVAAFVHSAVRCVSNDDEAHTAYLTIDDALDSAVRDALGLDASAPFPDEDAPLASVGLTPLGAARLQETLVHSLGRRLRRSLPATLAFDRPTVAALRAFLVDEGVGFGPNAESVAEARAERAFHRRESPRRFRSLSSTRVRRGRRGRDPRTRHHRSRHHARRFDLLLRFHLLLGLRPRGARVALGRLAARRLARRAPPELRRIPAPTSTLSDVELAGIARAEALAMDPQQRLVLDACAALFLGVFAGDRRAFAKACATFVGVSQTEYARVAEPHAPAYGPYHASGAHLSVVAGRVAFALALGGPAEAIDTACSSSLVAACRARQWTLDADDASTDDPRGALAGGVNLTLDVSWSLMRRRANARTGRTV